MNYYSGRNVTFLFFLWFSVALSTTVIAQDKSNLSEAIQNAIDAKGVDAAKKQFTSMNKSEREQYNIDTEGISELTNTYLEDGNMEALMAISEISGIFMQDAVAKSMKQYGAEMEAMEEMAKQREAEREQERIQREQERAHERKQSIIERQGQPRDDLKRFTGVYGNPDDSESTQQLWITVSCDGYLVSGAMWGDAAPWWLRSESENVFSLQDSFNNIRMEFETAVDGSVTEMIYNLDFMESPLKHVGPLPEDWSSCLERYQ